MVHGAGFCTHTCFSARVYSDKKLENIGLAPRTARSSHLWEVPLSLLGREGAGAACSDEMPYFQSAQMKGDESA